MPDDLYELEAVIQTWLPGKVRSGKVMLNEEGTCYVRVDRFAALFGSVPETPTYDDFVAIDGGRLGYIPFFDQCKAEGILS